MGVWHPPPPARRCTSTNVVRGQLVSPGRAGGAATSRNISDEAESVTPKAPAPDDEGSSQG